MNKRGQDATSYYYAGGKSAERWKRPGAFTFAAIAAKQQKIFTPISPFPHHASALRLIGKRCPARN